MDFLALPERSTKPREAGLTHLLDKGLGPAQVADLLATAAAYIDIVKLGWGTAYVTGSLTQKIDLYHGAGIPVCLGGTLLELALRQNRLEEYLRATRALGLRHIEVSDGTVSMQEEDKLALIRRLAKEFTVLSEVGSKDPDVALTPSQWIDAIQRELDAGAWKVITEGRESGTVGVFQPSGEIKEALLAEIVAAVSAENLLFETPAKGQQAWFVRRFGANVNLGNIPPEDALSVETLRLGLRGDTLLHFH